MINQILFIIKNNKRFKLEKLDYTFFDKNTFHKIKLKDDSTCKLEFIEKLSFFKIKYCDEDFGLYSTDNLDLMILEVLEILANYNNGDSINIKTKLEELTEERPTLRNRRYPTTYKNSTLKYLLGLEDNIIKRACMEQKLTYQQLADAIGLSESSLRSAVSTNKVSKQVEKSIEMYLKIIQLEEELEKANTIKQVLKSWLTQ